MIHTKQKGWQYSQPFCREAFGTFGGLELDYSLGYRLGHRFGAVVHLQFLEDVSNVGLYGALGDQ